MAEFFSQAKISNPRHVYGRTEKMKKLLDYANSITQLQIIGARRFGKTTISLCVENALRQDQSSSIYPIYTDVKNDRIRGTANFYRYLIGKLIEKLYHDGIFTEEMTFGRVSLNPAESFIYSMEDLSSSPDAYMVDTFKKIVSYFAEKMNKTILVIFDEYEYMAETTFDNLDGFMPLRNFSTDPLDSGLRPFFFWLVGARPWGDFVKEKRLSNVEVIGGSGEFNNVEISVYIPPISREDFMSFWNDRCEEYYGEPDTEEIIAEKELLLSYGEKAYSSISGVPFYANSLAKFIKVEKSFPSYSIIKDNLSEMVNLFGESTKSLMRELCSPIFVPQNDDYNTLSDDGYGLITCNEEGKCMISMGFLRDFLMANYSKEMPTESNIPTATTKKSEQISQLLDEINRCIYNINETCRNKKHDRIFISTPDDRENDRRIMRVCSNEEEFGQLLITLTKIYYESSKKPNGKGRTSYPGQALAELETDNPLAYKKRKFFQVLEPLRTYYGAHLKDAVERKNDYQLEKGEALFELQGHKNEPDTPEQWFQLQLKMLQLFLIELNTVKQKVNNLPDSPNNDDNDTQEEVTKPSIKVLGKIELPNVPKTVSTPASERTFTGIYSKTHNKVKSETFPYPYEVRTKVEELYDGAEVVFERGSEPNANDPNKTYYFAKNVRLK